ncbi:hypothetical protein OnM2_077006 [Erysiphe neolycopersici]|uniref:Uncharacterized protein n=1 Tax=Erysiphe neolycopersici TaxID=212602 RepID=A0A420HI58_9PEZI|nr:hypothetical protein OnM2_077006 [Erysiphe neolycopersici]
MASHNREPTSPVRVPKAVSNYTASTIDTETRSSVNSRLLVDGHIPKIHDALLHALHASPTNWPTLIQNHALSLLRSGECTTFHEVLERVLEDIHVDTVVARSSVSQTPDLSSNGHSGGEKRSESNGTKNFKGMEGSTSSSNSENRQSLVIPPNVVEEGIRITRECLETMCEIDD